MAAIFFDIDGTIWARGNIIPESTKEAIRLLKENGHYVFLNSGRTMGYIFDENLLAMDFDGIVSGCGTCVDFHGENLLYVQLTKEQISRYIDLFEKYKMITIMEGRKLIYMNTEDVETDEYGRYLISTLTGRYLPIRCKEDQWEVSKFSVIIEGTDYESMIAELGEEMSILMHGTYVAEVIPAGYTKATGIATVCEKLGIDVADTYVFGDSVNDVEMLKFAGCGIAMGNGTPEAKENADYVTDGLFDDGIYNACRHFGLI